MQPSRFVATAAGQGVLETRLTLAGPLLPELLLLIGP
jgi:hypothetical protein